MDALLIVDVQNDFCPGGALAVEGGDEIVPLVNEMAREAPFVVATRDWHPAAHSSFEERGGQWPVHCVQGTEGAELHAALDRARVHAVVDKGQDPLSQGYSAFQESPLERLLRGHGIRRVWLAGLATDYCVRASALDALDRGFEVTVIEDAVRGIDVHPGDSERALAEVRAAGARVAPAAELAEALPRRGRA
jgi:nicotinamidase/pyrazinamidase